MTDAKTLGNMALHPEPAALQCPGITLRQHYAGLALQAELAKVEG